MLLVKILFVLISISLAVGINGTETDLSISDSEEISRCDANGRKFISDSEEIPPCYANGRTYTGQKKCIERCRMECTRVNCGLFKKCEKIASGKPYGTYKCHCNFE